MFVWFIYRKLEMLSVYRDQAKLAVITSEPNIKWTFWDSLLWFFGIGRTPERHLVKFNALRNRYINLALDYTLKKRLKSNSDHWVVSISEKYFSGLVRDTVIVWELTQSEQNTLFHKFLNLGFYVWRYSECGDTYISNTHPLDIVSNKCYMFVENKFVEFLKQ